MNVGDKVKYNFPSPKNPDKIFVRGVITYIGETLIAIKCEDKTDMKITIKNFKNIQMIDYLPKEKLVSV